MNQTKLNVTELTRRLSEQDAGGSVFYQEETDSTNEWAKREAARGAADGSIFLADFQRSGKGRRGRVWTAPPGTSVTMSLLLRPQLPAAHASMLTLVMGLAAAAGIREISTLDVGIKWPNDVVIQGKKLCGILTEMNSSADYVVIGIGINVNTPFFPAELKETATSLFLESGSPFSREAAAAAVLLAFRRYYACFLEHGNLSGLLEPYHRLLVNRGRAVRVLDPKQPFSGTAVGINVQGELLVKREDTGKTEPVFAGEVSVRGVYGYV